MSDLDRNYVSPFGRAATRADAATVDAGLRAHMLRIYNYMTIGLATAVFGVIAGSIAAWLIVTRLMTLSFIWQAGSAAGVVAAALIVTVGLGLAGTLLALNQKPATVLRNL